MGKEEKYRISVLGEFMDKSMEDEFLTDSLSSSKTMTAYLALVFGLILGLFLAHSYITDAGTPLFARITPIRIVFILASVFVYFISRSITKPNHLVLVVSFYQAMMGLTYLLTLKHYGSLTYFSVLGLLVITLAMYLLPNRIVLSQLITLAFSVLFFVFPSRKLEGLQPHELHRIIAYQTIMLIHCNINYGWTGRTKRRHFVANRELFELSIRDSLTGAYNRKKFDDAVDEWIKISQRYGNPLSIIFFDIDNFKAINDQHGHLVGDGVLKDVAAVVGQQIRETDVFARWGGDEFVILLPNTDLVRAEQVVERIRASLGSSAASTLKGITCSFGVAACEEHDTKQSLLRKVDHLLLQAKTAGKDRVVG